jgi:hypothetical protein
MSETSLACAVVATVKTAAAETIILFTSVPQQSRGANIRDSTKITEPQDEDPDSETRARVKKFQIVQIFFNVTAWSLRNPIEVLLGRPPVTGFSLPACQDPMRINDAVSRQRAARQSIKIKRGKRYDSTS